MPGAANYIWEKLLTLPSEMLYSTLLADSAERDVTENNIVVKADSTPLIFGFNVHFSPDLQQLVKFFRAASNLNP